MWDYFALPPVIANDVGLDQVFGSGVKIWPCCKTLPMGFSHAVFLAQTAHENVLDSLPSFKRTNRLSKFNDTRLDRVRHQVYIDDLSIFGTDASEVKAAQEEYITMITMLGLNPKASKIVAPSTCVECLGLELDGVSHVFGLSASKLCALILLGRFWLQE